MASCSRTVALRIFPPRGSGSSNQGRKEGRKDFSGPLFRPLLSRGGCEASHASQVPAFLYSGDRICLQSFCVSPCQARYVVGIACASFAHPAVRNRGTLSAGGSWHSVWQATVNGSPRRMRERSDWLGRAWRRQARRPARVLPQTAARNLSRVRPRRRARQQARDCRLRNIPLGAPAPRSNASKRLVARELGGGVSWPGPARPRHPAAETGASVAWRQRSPSRKASGPRPPTGFDKARHGPSRHAKCLPGGPWKPALRVRRPWDTGATYGRGAGNETGELRRIAGRGPCLPVGSRRTP
jgi:hypothetical protein